jgi:glucan endo-1,6-beta-glucosidase
MIQLLPMILWAGTAYAAAHPVNKPRASTPAAFISSSDGRYKLSSWSAPVRGSGSPNGESTWTLDLDDTSSGHKQQITGFGAAVTDATVAVFNGLSSSTRSQLLNELLTSAGADFSLLRHTIASSDLSADPAYSYDDNGGQVDTSLNSFNLGDRGNAMASLLATMKGVNPSIKILGSSWSAPGWMKLNGELTGSTTDNNLADQYLNKGPDYSAAFAQYFVKYIQANANKGANIDAITIQNEPLNSRAGYPTMYVFDYESASLIQNHVGPALRSAGLSTEIWAYDHNTGTVTPVLPSGPDPSCTDTAPQMCQATQRQSSTTQAPTSTPLPGTAMPTRSTGRC